MIRETSIEVYHQIKQEGLLSRRRWEVYEVIFNQGPMSIGMVCTELARRGIDSRSISPRFAELRDMELIKEVRTDICKSTGREVIFWDVTSNLPKEFKREKKATYKELELKITQLEAEIRYLKDRNCPLCGQKQMELF